MLSILKKLFGRSSAPEAAPLPRTPTILAANQTLPTQPKSPTPGVPGGQIPAPAPPPGDSISISVEKTVAGMPDNLKKRLDKKLNGTETFHITRAEALRQLPTGVVKIPFREIVRMVPNTFLSPDEEMLATEVALPLGEILSKVKNLPRRADQKQVEVPTDIEGLFGQGAGGGKPKSTAVPAPATTTPAPEPVRPPAPAPLPKPTPAPTPPPVAAKEEIYIPPAPKTLEPVAPISFKLPETKPAVAPAPTPSPSLPTTSQTPATSQTTRVVAAPSPPGVTPPKPAAASAPLSMAAAPAALDAPSISLGDIFGQPDKKDWTPQEVVQTAAGLRGVVGALITTADGLPVAFHLPENLNGNVIGAFVPQMFTRITQYTRDLKLGDAKHLTIIVENTPLQIFKSGSIYFTALGKAGENLPKPQLTAIAAALGRQ